MAKALGLLGLDRSKNHVIASADSLSEQEVEEKFSSLALAFKTDTQTLEQRIMANEEARDLAERNINATIDDLKRSVAALGSFCTEKESYDIFQSIQHHLNVLDQTCARVSSSSEIHGAVQQEFRMNKAIEVMIAHVENLRRTCEKEHEEWQAAKKSQHEPPYYSSTAEQGDRLADTTEGARPKQDARARFQSLVVNTAVKSTITSLFRKSSSRSIDQVSTGSTKASFNSSISHQGSASTTDENIPNDVESKICQELQNLRAQQNELANELKNLEAADENEEGPVERLWHLWPLWSECREHIRLLTALTVFVLALASVLLTVFSPSGEASFHWYSLQELLEPFSSSLHHHSVPPS